MANRDLETKKQKKDAIEELQNMLYKISRYEKNAPSILPDGIFGRETTEAVKEFQRNNSMEETGVVDNKTWDAIYVRFKEIDNEKKPPRQIDFFGKDGFCELVYGDSRDAIFLIQILFNNLSKLFSEFNEGEINGNLDSKTEGNIIAFQKINGLEGHGRVDKKTWERIALYYNSFKN